jgi:hypothetical protein
MNEPKHIIAVVAYVTNEKQNDFLIVKQDNLL